MDVGRIEPAARETREMLQSTLDSLAAHVATDIDCGGSPASRLSFHTVRSTFILQRFR